jgi:hypothetical protein
MSRRGRLRREQTQCLVKGDSPVCLDRRATSLDKLLPGALDAPSLLSCDLAEARLDGVRPSPVAAIAPTQLGQAPFRIQHPIDIPFTHRVALYADVGIANAAGR